MGINERDYIRRAPPRRGSYGRGGLSGWRSWSINTWLIVICVAVFVVDGLMPHSWYRPVRTSSDVPAHVEELLGQQYEELRHPNEPENWAPRQLRGQSRTFERAVFDTTVSPPEQQGSTFYEWMPPLTKWLHFSTEKAFLGIEYWRFIGFQFLHANLTHLLFNMVGLFFFGPLVERYLGSKRYLAFYLLCGILGAIMYLLLNLGGYIAALRMGEGLVIPGLLFNSPATPLVGASAGVFGVLMAGAFLVPNATVLLFFIIPMRLVTLAYALVIFALFIVIVGASNAGGQAGHLGGAIAGYYFIRHTHHLHGFFDFVGRIDPTSHHYRGKFKGKGFSARDPKRTEIDRILDKISTKGIQSLTDREKSILRKQSER